MSIIGLIFNFIGTVVLAFSLIKSNRTIEKESGTYFGGNQYIESSLIRNRRLAVIGLSFLAIGFALQLLEKLITL